MCGAQFAGSLACCWLRIDSDDPSTHRDADCHRGQTDAAAAVNRQPLAAGNPTMNGDRAKCRGKPATQCRRGDESHSIRQPHQVRVSSADHDLFGERAGSGETGLVLLRADLGIARNAVFAPATALHEGSGHPLAHPETIYRRADLGNDAGKLMARYLGQRDRIVTPPRMPVRPAHAGGPDRNDRAVVGALGIGNLANPG